MAKKDITQQTPGTDLIPGQDAPEQTNEGTSENPQAETTLEGLKAQIERLEILVSSFEKTIKSFASIKGVQPMAPRTKKMYKPILKKSKKQ